MRATAVGSPAAGCALPDGPDRPKPTFVSIQILRGIAAISVLLSHSVFALPVNPPAGLAPAVEAITRPFAFGVDIFFIISGFVMAATIDGDHPPSAGGFLLRRAIRIFPLYWLASLIYLPSTITGVGGGAHLHDVQSVVLSFLLLPQNYMLVDAGWTLTHELIFYGIVAATVHLNLRHRLGAIIVTLALVALMQELTNTTMLYGYGFSLFMVEFWAGLLLYRWRRHLADVVTPARVRWCLGLAALLVAVVAVTVTPRLTYVSMPSRVFGYGAIAVLIVVVMLTKEAPLARRGATGLARMTRLLGDTSYSIYLFHIPLLGGVGAILTALSIRNPAILVLTTAVAVFAATGFGVAIGRLIERPLLAHARNLLEAACRPKTTASTEYASAPHPSAPAE